jgi:hypothetical protein
MPKNKSRENLSWISKYYASARSENSHLHINVLVRVVLIYVAYRIISRPAIQYGLLGASDASWPRPVTSFYPVEFSQAVGFPFIQQFFWPTPEIIAVVQLAGVAAAIFGAIGLHPRVMILVVFLSLSYTTWMMQTTNAEIDGGTLVLALTLWFTFFSSRSLGFLGNFPWSSGSQNHKVHRTKASAEGLLGSQLIIGSFYFLSGINKLVDVGFDFPIRLKLTNLASAREYEVVHESARLGNPLILQLVAESEILSVAAGFVVVLSELLFLPSLLLFRSARAFSVTGLAALHVIVYLTAGINFLGNLVIILGALDLSRGIRIGKGFLQRTHLLGASVRRASYQRLIRLIKP